MHARTREGLLGCDRLAAVVLSGCLVASAAGPAPAAAQSSAPATFTVSDTAGLGGTYGTLRTVLERTFLRVDVLSIEVRLDGVAAARIAPLAGDGRLTDAEEDSVSAAAIGAREVWVRMRFLRDVDTSRLIDESRASMRKARDAGLLTRADYDSLAAELPAWYAPLETRGVKSGDVQLYRVRGDTLRTTFTDEAGHVWIEREGIGRARRLALLGSWFVRGSDFRNGLLRSLVRR